MKDNDLITRREVELILLEKGQETERYKWGEQWELNFSEIREVLSEYQPEIVRCKDCKYWYFADNRIPCERENVCGRNGIVVTPEWFCADGKRAVKS